MHGLASPLGAFFPIPHGVVCGTLVAAATEVNIRVLKEREPDNPALGKYARLGELLCNKPFDDADEAHQTLVERGVEFLAPPETQPWGGVLAHFRDPDRNVITLLGSPE